MTYTFGKKLKQLRKKERLTLAGLAKKSKVPFHTIVALEVGRSKVPLITTVIKLAKYFKISIEEFIKDVTFKD